MSARRVSSMGLAGKSTRIPPVPWAVIGSIAGAAADTTYTDTAGVTWRCVQWNASNASGLVLAVPGLADVIIVGGGSGYIDVSGFGGDLDDQPGGGGDCKDGYRFLAAGLHAVVVGPGGSANGYPWGTPGTPSSLGSITTRTGRLYGMNDVGLNTPVTSAITGTSLTYAAGGFSRPSSSGKGDGGASAGQAGTTGTVIIRVPA